MPRPILPTLLALVLFPAMAQEIDVGMGLSFTRDNEDTLVVAAAWLPRFKALGDDVLCWEVGGLFVRGRNHSRYRNAEDVSVLHAGLRYERASGLTAGFGMGVQHGWSEALSGDPQFISTLGWRWGQFSLLARHISNASLHQPNDGETMLQAAWRF